MSIVIVGGNECMACRYREICSKYGHEAKVFCKMRDGMKCKIGNPDLMILFTSTVSHKMIRCVLDEVDSSRTDIVRCHTSSGSALTEILEQRCC